MTSEYLKELIKKGENLNIEFKSSQESINRDVYETICAFLNRNGGYIFLGVDDHGKIKGIVPDKIDKMKKDLVTSINNPQLINPPLYLNPKEIVIDGKNILMLYIPESSQVHRCRGRIFDRNEDGDIDITDHHNSVADLYLRKQTTFTENTIYPYVSLNDLRKDLFDYVRKLISAKNSDHPWLSLNNFDLIKSARLYQKDYKTGKKGFTLAAVLLFGKDEVIQSIYHIIRQMQF